MTTKEEPTDAQIQRLREAVFAQSQRERQHPDGRAGLYYPSIEAARTMLLAAAPDHQAEAPSDARAYAEQKWPIIVTGYADSDGERFEYESYENRKLREAYLEGVAARPVVDDAAVERVLAEARKHRALWLDADRIDRGGIHCACGKWSASIDGIARPWKAYWRHEAEATARAALTAALGVVFEQTHQPNEQEHDA